MNQSIQNVSRGDVFYADLSPVVGSEQGGMRPVLILQNDVGNRHSPTTIVCAITGSTNKKFLPTHVSIGSVGKLSQTSVALLEQLRTIDRSRLQDRIGRLSTEKITQIDHALAVSIGLAPALFCGRRTEYDKYCIGKSHHSKPACQHDANAESPAG